MKSILRIILFIGILLGVVLLFVLPRKALSEDVEVIENVRVIHERPDIKTYAKEKVGNEWWAFNYIITHESQWKWKAQNPHSSAFGLCQRMMGIYTEDDGYREDKYNQIDWCVKYARTRYGSITKAQKFWSSNHWW